MTPSTLAVNTLDISGVAWLLRPLFAGRGVAVGLHRVLPPGMPTLMPGNIVTTSQFEEMLAFFQRSGYDFIGIDEVPERVKSRARRRFAVITFDDGYVDNVLHALPLLEAFGAPFTVYCVSGIVDRRILPWWVFLERLILHSDEMTLHDPSEGPVTLPCRTMDEKRIAYRRFHRCGYHTAAEFQAVLTEAFRQRGWSSEQLVCETVLSAEQIHSLSQHRLATIGCHTVSHIALTTLPGERVVKELKDCRTRLEEVIGQPVTSVAYPFGLITDREPHIASELGFKTGVSTARGTIGENCDPFAIPRIMPSLAPHARTLRFVRVSVYGAWNKIANYVRG